jgi:copper chaperone CopZ
MKTTIYVPDITCESCTRLIGKKLKNEPTVKNISFFDEGVLVEHEGEITPQKITELITSQGFRASTEPFDYKTFKERRRDFAENPHRYSIERKGITYAALTFLILFILEAIAYVGFFNTIPNFFAKYGLWFLYLNISIAAIGFAAYHVLSYKTKITHMVGMMIGMTFGMQAGLLIGAILGATNGFFVGATVGMLTAVVLGAIMGKCCGIMGIMEGMMAGVMGGTMGAMTSYMMLSDHLTIFMPIFVLINIIIIAGLSYLFYEEAVEGKVLQKKPVDFATFISLSILVTAVLTIIMVYGPRSALLGG